MKNDLYVHLIQDEKFLPPFMDRAQRIYEDHLYVVFGPKPPYKSLEESDNVIHSSQWDAYMASNEVSISRVYIHYLTYQKIKFFKNLPNVPVYWMFYGNDLYELLQTVKGFGLYEKEDSPKGLLAHVRGASAMDRIKRWLTISYYSRIFAKFVRSNIDYFCFWNPHDFELLQRHYGSSAQLLRFQYGAFQQSELDGILEIDADKKDSGKIKLLLNHSGSVSGNHHHLIELLDTFDLNSKDMELVAPLSYGDQHHIDSVLELGKNKFGEKFNPLMDFMKRDAYFKLLSEIDIAIFGHRRQEAGNALFILFITGSKIFLNPKSVLIPFLKSEGYVFYTWDDIGSEGWLEPLSKSDRDNNSSLGKRQFSQERVWENYHNVLD